MPQVLDSKMGMEKGKKKSIWVHHGEGDAHEEFV